jgi:hypothetical protein
MNNTQLLAKVVEQQVNFVLFILVMGYILVCTVLSNIKHNSRLGNKVEPSTYLQRDFPCCTSKILVPTLPLVKLKKFARNTIVGTHAHTKVSITTHSDIWRYIQQCTDSWKSLTVRRPTTVYFTLYSICVLFSFHLFL